ncbi:acyl-CoA dehydrogenase family protein [Amycolatopsis sp. cg5]|uniref:acyl-CoA dehydrogenase family protein n=1 Tax=Amycolatopsis sp. cg5 TaxID=3238802 RepID=UPI003524150B
MPFPDDVGGAGHTHPALATAVAVEELAYYSNNVAAIFDVHCILSGNALDQGTSEQRQRWLRPLVTGEFVGAFATSEPSASTAVSAGSPTQRSPTSSSSSPAPVPVCPPSSFRPRRLA